MSSMAAALIKRWAVLWCAFNYTLKYLTISENWNGVIFSCFASNGKDSCFSLENNIFMTELIHASVTSKEIEEFSKRKPITSNVIDFVLSGCPSKVNKQLKQYLCQRNELAVDNSCLIWGNKVAFSWQWREKKIKTSWKLTRYF